MHFVVFDVTGSFTTRISADDNMPIDPLARRLGSNYTTSSRGYLSPEHSLNLGVSVPILRKPCNVTLVSNAEEILG